jgi:hypothetical protein
MATPFCAAVLLPLALAKRVPDGIHLCQARLIETTAAPCQFLFDPSEAVFEFGNGLTQSILSAHV